MAATERTVRHLRLRTPGEATARRLVTTLEDALRCASLGDDGGRLVLVRRLALGRVADGITSQALSRLIEERLAQAALHWVDGEADEAPSSDCVAFTGRLHARTALALRLLRGQVVAAWYWPRAVGEFVAGGDEAANLRRIAWTIAGWPEARIALPAWVAELVQRGMGARLAVAIGEREGEALLARAGLGMLPAPAPARQQGDAPAEDMPAASPHRARRPRVEPSPVARWMRRALEGWPASRPMARQPGSATSATAIEAARRAKVDASDASDRTVPAPRKHIAKNQTLRARIDADGNVVPDEGPGAASPIPRPASARVARAPDPSDTPISPATPGPAWLEPTACGGLLFLLPVLERIGLPASCAEEEAVRIAAGVLRRALVRVHAPEDDPLWALAPAQHVGTDGQAAVWLHGARRWLHRAARLGLVRLVRRPARVACTPTHVDLHFALDQADLRLRRLGLDGDPGWLPWFGRVVGFHFGALP